ncbi:MAG: GAF domain-containing protein [Bacteroidales bacterium]|nr:GAF domain-containing protein [Bacteroidales bacterium]
MKKLSLHNILFIGFGVILLFVLIYVVREIVFLNGIINSDEEIQSIVQEQKMVNKMISVYDSEMNLVKNVVVSEDKKEFPNFLKEHTDNANTFIKYKEELRLLFSANNEIFDNTEAIKLTEDFFGIYKKEADPLIKSLIKEKEKLTVIELNSYQTTKPEYINALFGNIKEIENQIKESSEIITDNLHSLLKIIEKNYSDLNEQKNELFRAAQINVFVFLIVIILLLALIFAYTSKYVFKPLAGIQEFINLLTGGEIPDELHLNSGKDLIIMTSGLNKIITDLKNAVNFSEALSAGNFSSSFRPVSENDSLGNTLLKLKESLIKSQEEESVRKQEELQRQKTNEGLTMFAEILRRHSENIQDLADTVISSLVNFMDANQGALFFLNDENPENIFYELIGAYAYNRKKYLTKEVKLGEGLVGAVALEKYTVYMTDIPEDYIEIESGTGTANPRSVLIVPLKIEDQVLGVIELASFNEFKKEEIATVEKIAESIASSLSNAKINMQTSKLNEQFSERVKLLQQTEKELEESLVKIKELTRKNSQLERENKRLKKLIES